MDKRMTGIKHKLKKRYDKVIRGLGFDYAVVDKKDSPEIIFDELEDMNILSGRRSETILSICIYLSLKRQGRVFMKKDFVKFFDLTEVGFRNNIKMLKRNGLLATSSDRYRDRAVMREEHGVTGASVGSPQEGAE